MIRASVWFVPVVSLLVFTSSVNAQELIGHGTVATQSLVRNRQGISEKGDVVTVTAHQPAGNKGFAISAHAEYQEDSGKWQGVPTPKSMLGAWYTSAKYGGLRDLVDVGPTAEATDRNVALFVPIIAFAPLAGKECNFRYVIRVWDPNDKELSSVTLEPYRVRVDRDGDGISVSMINPNPCGPTPAKGKPVAQPHGTSVVRLFDTATGKWVCPDVKQASKNAAAKQ